MQGVLKKYFRKKAFLKNAPPEANGRAAMAARERRRAIFFSFREE